MHESGSLELDEKNESSAELVDWAPPAPDEIPLHFTVDAALLRQLGERLVGRPAVALAELVKNSYDADATVVRISFDENTIRVVDNGHGMTRDEFSNYWMRVGTTHKEREELSPRFGRRLTGSKGVGRLAVQFLAKRAHVRTVAIESTETELRARINWVEAVSAGDLISARMLVHEGPSKRGFPAKGLYGTAVTLSDLRHSWSTTEVTELARELWSLQPPFVAIPSDETLGTEDRRGIRIEFSSTDPKAIETFRTQISAALDLWDARIIGRYRRDANTGQGEASIILEFRDEPQEHTGYLSPIAALDRADYEIRVFKLQGRQSAGIRVADARDYLAKFGGVQVYDSGFRLPYYGVETDWLGVEQAHSHRLSTSELLPKELQVERGLNFLPSNSRLFGVVRITTTHETNVLRDKITSPLAISVTRDRLVEGEGHAALRDFVRWGLDYYATRAALRAAASKAAEAKIQTAEAEIAVEDQLAEALLREGIVLSTPVKDRVRSAIASAVAAATERVATIEEEDRLQISLIGPLATAGIVALSYDHELVKQFQLLEAIAESIEGQSSIDTYAIPNQIREWITRARATRGLFAHLGTQEDREEISRFNASRLLTQLLSRSRPLLRGVQEQTVDIDPDLLLPPGTVAEWSAIFQNVILNAYNAMLESGERTLALRSHTNGSRRSIRVEDTGSGVDLRNATALFDAFERRTEISAERRALGLGGLGLGLAIVRMIATSRHAVVRFVQPSAGFRTSFELSWHETT